MKQNQFCPVTSQEIMDAVVNRLGKAEAVSASAEELFRFLEILESSLPERYFPDVYLDLPLLGEHWEGLAAVFDCYDRCFVNTATEGDYFRRIHADPRCEPEDRDRLLILKAESAGVSAVFEEFAFDPVSSSADEAEGLSELCSLPLSACRKTESYGECLILRAEPDLVGHDLLREDLKEPVLGFLRAAGVREEILSGLNEVSFISGIPYQEESGKSREWLVRTDLAALRITVRDGKIIDCHGILRISDRVVPYLDLSLKPVRAYQWHITDLCDQRCRHCYLFAEDAGKPCDSMSWEEIMITIDAIEEDAAERGMIPLPAITGGDPILHPWFWRLARAIHDRGWRWMMMGNPFHLSREVCRELYQLGCIKYQLSLDGLQEFHDSMRKPGSYAATLEAAALLNEAGIRSQLMATVSRRNMEDVLACMDTAAAHQVRYFVFARYCATAREKASDYPSPEEYRSFLLRYYEKAKAYREKGCATEFQFKEHLFTLLRYELKEFEIPGFAGLFPNVIFGGCHVGQTCCILPNGDVMACRHMANSVIGNLFRENLHELLNGPRSAVYFEVRNIHRCRDCELLFFCRGCRAVGVNMTGDLQAEDPCCWKERGDLDP